MVALESAELFRSLKSEDLRDLRPVILEQAYEPGQDIFRSGEPGEGLYVVKSGRVKISGMVNPETRLVFSELGPGEVFGEMSVIEQQPRSATATAAEATTVYFIPRFDMLNIVARAPVLAISLLQLVSRRLREFNQHYLDEVVEAERHAAVGRFARSIVHDLKNPLNIISLTAHVACKPDTQPNSRAAAETRIQKQIGRINDLVGDVLEFTHNSEPGEQIPTNYAEFVNQIVAELQPDLELRSVRLELSNPPPSLMIRLDPKRLRRVFANLIHNAADFLPENGAITLRFWRQERELITEVADNGPGIAEEIADKLFEAFATHGKPHGSGLGLSICKKIIGDHCGRIWAANDPDGGAVFSFALPLKG